MAEESPLSATGDLTEPQFERMAHPQAADGLIGHPDDAAPVTVSGGQIIVRAGLAGLVRGFPWASGASDVVLTPTLTGPARVDLVVLRLHRDDGYRVGAAIRAGTGEVAPAPAAGTGPTDWYEIPIAEVRAANGALTVTKIRAWYLGEDGQILCKANARPPMTAGRRIWETDTGRAYVCTGAAWVSIHDDSSWVGVTAVGGWGLSGGASHVRRREGTVHLRLLTQRTGGTVTEGADINIATIPAGFRPGYPVPFLAYLDSAYLARGYVLATGAVQLQNYTRSLPTGIWVTLHPVSWLL